MREGEKRRYALVVVGGGISGVCAALAAARHGCDTALIQDRPVLGGNASSEIRMHIVGATCQERRPDARETGIIEEILLENQRRNPQHSFSVCDTILWEKCMAEPRLSLYLNTRMLTVETDGGRVRSVTAHQSTTEKWFTFEADYFVDATGDGMLASEAGAAFAQGREARDAYGESLAPAQADGCTMGNSILFTARDMGKPVPFERPAWAHCYEDKDIPGHLHHNNGRVVEATSGYWWLELGGDALSSIDDAEQIRDELLKTLYGVWDHLKNRDQGCENLALDWVGFLPGKRESRRVLGDYVLTQDDLVSGRTFPDDVAYGGWHLDLHPVGGFAAFGQFEEPDEETRALKHLKGLYGIPYRCLYTRDVENLFLAGRAISVSHVAFGSTRVMATCALVGQAVGVAAAMAAREGLTPRGIGKRMDALQQALMREDCYLPGKQLHHAANIAPLAAVTASSQQAEAPCAAVTDGFLRAAGDDLHCWRSAPDDARPWLSLAWNEPVAVAEVIIRFDSNCSHDYMTTLSDWMKARLTEGIPRELVQDYDIELLRNGETVHTVHVQDNHLRFRVHPLPQAVICDALRLTVLTTRGVPEARVFSLEAYTDTTYAGTTCKKVRKMPMTFEKYSAERIGSDAIALYADGVHWFTLPVRSAVDTVGQTDADDGVLVAQEEAIPGGVRITWRTKSNLWAEKAYIVEMTEAAFTYRICVRGRGRLQRIRYFTEGVRYEASGYLLPVATHADEAHCMRAMHEPETIALGYFVPPLFCYPFRMAGQTGWFGLGLFAKAGGYAFDSFHYRPEGNRFQFELPLEGQTRVEDEWESQGIWGAPGADWQAVLGAYAAWHYDTGLCVKPTRDNIPAWWRGPIFCGWGEQNTLADKAGVPPQAFATQAAYERMSDQLDAAGLDPAVIVIDDKWQQTFGGAMPDEEKWPDLRAFVDAQHAKGRRVLLWFKAWNNEGLMESECATLLCAPCGADPTNPAYIRRVHDMMRNLLSDAPGCCNCDGFKIDFANCMPLGDLIRVHEPGVYGVELLKCLFTLLHDAAKAVKPDALINTSCAHPYFAEVTDQIRLHDYRTEMNQVVEVMTFRQRMAAAAMPGALIDTDSGGVGSRRDFHRYIKAQPGLGVPDLYWLSATGDVPFDETDYAVIREAWAEYRRGLAK